MNHLAESHINSSASTKGAVGIHMSASVGIEIPYNASFTPRVAKPMKVDITKVAVIKR